jgi:hypothetical protein
VDVLPLVFEMALTGETFPINLCAAVLVGDGVYQHHPVLSSCLFIDSCGVSFADSSVAYVISPCVFPGEVFLMLHQMSFIALNARLESFTEASDSVTIGEELFLTTRALDKCL